MNEKKINLIPSDLVVPAKVKSLVNLFNKINLILVVVLFFVLFIFVGLYLYLSTEFNNVNLSVNDLKTEISFLEQNEQKLILIKDRLVKIRKVQTLASINESLLTFKNLESSLIDLSDFELGEILVNSSKVEVSVKTTNLKSLSYFFDQIDIIKNFKNISLVNLSFNTIKGFVASLVLSN